MKFTPLLGVNFREMAFKNQFCKKKNRESCISAPCTLRSTLFFWYFSEKNTLLQPKIVLAAYSSKPLWETVERGGGQNSKKSVIDPRSTFVNTHCLAHLCRWQLWVFSSPCFLCGWRQFRAANNLQNQWDYQWLRSVNPAVTRHFGGGHH